VRRSPSRSSRRCAGPSAEVIRLAVRAPAEHAERVLAALIELAPGGFEQVDADDFVEFALYGAPGELPVFPAADAELGGVRVQVSGVEVADDWAERWREFHRPLLVGERLWVRPPWAEPRPGVVDLVIDPAQAFGTGAHPTTRLSLELLLGLDPGGPLTDLGCGSGVLAIAAAKLGFEPVIALDNETAALEATRSNAAANGVALSAIERHNLREAPAPASRTVCANLMRPLLLRVAELLPEPPERLIVSGLLDEEADEVAGAFAPLRECARRSAQGWSAVLLGG
jgi:ribosomal protein L11 methyltransferase